LRPVETVAGKTASGQANTLNHPFLAAGPAGRLPASVQGE
jgi:hypothetical protein